MRVTKVKYKEGRMKIEYSKQNDKKGWDDFTLDCEDAPRPEYEQAIKNLSPFVVELCELPQEYTSRIIVKSVSFSYGGEAGIMGAVISGAMKLMNSNCPLNLNTPHKPSKSYNPTGCGSEMLLSRKCVEALEAVQSECLAYIKGHRAQGVLL